mmetsp:Transcript_14354/g.32964  ORF Transcript_14354/g.32964 Transcript_14354/m.32964 type:complete len:214 (-) Transcript_14354:731-1372(-)
MASSSSSGCCPGGVILRAANMQLNAVIVKKIPTDMFTLSCLHVSEPATMKFWKTSRSLAMKQRATRILFDMISSMEDLPPAWIRLNPMYGKINPAIAAMTRLNSGATYEDTAHSAFNGRHFIKYQARAPKFAANSNMDSPIPIRVQKRWYSLLGSIAAVRASKKMVNFRGQSESKLESNVYAATLGVPRTNMLTLSQTLLISSDKTSPTSKLR